MTAFLFGKSANKIVGRNGVEFTGSLALQRAKIRGLEMVGPNGLEPSTSSVSGRRSNQLSYGPTAYRGHITDSND